MPLDGYPVLGASPARPDVYFAVMHSGVTLAPIVGELAAREIVEGAPLERLNGFRPDRKLVASVVREWELVPPESGRTRTRRLSGSTHS
jgi:glycine/D-amino acid oxidase-like deaminating enzyme